MKSNCLSAERSVEDFVPRQVQGYNHMQEGTPAMLRLGVLSGDVNLVSNLASSGCCLHLPDANGFTALHAAAVSSHTRASGVIATLLASGASPDADYHSPLGLKPLHLAALVSSEAASAEPASQDSHTPLAPSLVPPGLSAWQHADQWERENFTVSQLVVPQHNPWHLGIDAANPTTFHAARPLPQPLPASSTCLQHGHAEMDLDDNAAIGSERPPPKLHKAASGSMRCDTDSAAEAGGSAAHARWQGPAIASPCGASAIELLALAGAHVDARDNCGATPLMYAAHEGNVSAVKLLLRLGANAGAAASYLPPLISGSFLSATGTRASALRPERRKSEGSPSCPVPRAESAVFAVARCRSDGASLPEPARRVMTRHCSDFGAGCHTDDDAPHADHRAHQHTLHGRCPRQCSEDCSRMSNARATTSVGMPQKRLRDAVDAGAYHGCTQRALVRSRYGLTNVVGEGEACGIGGHLWPPSPRKAQRCCRHACAAISTQNRHAMPSAFDVIHAAVVQASGLRQGAAASGALTHPSSPLSSKCCKSSCRSGRRRQCMGAQGNEDAMVQTLNAECSGDPNRLHISCGAVPAGSLLSHDVHVSRGDNTGGVEAKFIEACLEQWSQAVLAGPGQAAPEGATALFFAVHGGSLRALRALLSAGCMVTSSAVHLASSMLDAQQLALLTLYGGQNAANAVNKEGSTPLHTVLRHACGQCSTRPAVRCLNVLMRAGADSAAADRWGDPVTFEAARHLHSRPELLRCIISGRNPRVHARNSLNESLAAYIVKTLRNASSTPEETGARDQLSARAQQACVVERLAFLGAEFDAPMPVSHRHLPAAAAAGWRARRQFVLKALSRWNHAVTPHGDVLELPSVMLAKIALMAVPDLWGATPEYTA